MSKEMLFDPALHEKLRAGSEAVRKITEGNYGPHGRNTICMQTYDLPLVANSGRKILKDLELKDGAENIAAVMVRDAALKVAAECGDGSIETVILTDSLIAEGCKLTAAGYDPMALRRGLFKALDFARECLEIIAVPFDAKNIRLYASACAKNDEVAENVTRAFELVGPGGVITVKDTQMRETRLNLHSGVRYDYGLESSSFINDPEKRRAVLDEPYVFLCNAKIESIKDIQKLLEDASGTGSSLLIIANDISENVLKFLAANASRGMKLVAAKAPGHGDNRRWNMLALAAMTGSLLFEENTGRSMCDCGLEFCCKIGRAEVDRDSTTLQDFRDSSEEMIDIIDRHTRKLLKETTDPDQRDSLMTTLSIISGKTAEILAGGTLEHEMFEKKYLYENTIRSIQSAASSGYVPGAGNAYLYIADEIKKAGKGQGGEEALGAECLADAMPRLVKLLAENEGENGAEVLEKVEKQNDPYIGFDAKKRRLADLRREGILTPKSTAEMILTVAAETAASLWTAGAAVVEKPLI